MRNLGLLGCIGVLILAVLIFGGYFVSVRNNLVGLDEQVNAQWAQVESQYQRRYDLIPNLVRTVQGAANFEKSTLEAVVNARSRVGQVAVVVSLVAAFLLFANWGFELQRDADKIAQLLGPAGNTSYFPY